MYIYLHIPKTGGSSMRETLKNILGDKMFSFAENGDLRKYDRGFNYQRDFKNVPYYTRLFYGHYILNDFPVEYYGRFMTMFRDPVERIISNYGHEIRCGTYNKPIEEYIRDYKRTYGQRKISINIYESVLKGDIYAFENFAFIGITEHFVESVKLICSILEVEYNKKFITNSTINPNKKLGVKYNIDSNLKSIIKSINQIDCDYYNKALDYFHEMCDKHNIKIGD